MEFAENNKDTQLREFEVITLAVQRSGGIMGLGQKVELLTQRHPGRAEYRVEELGNGLRLYVHSVALCPLAFLPFTLLRWRVGYGV